LNNVEVYGICEQDHATNNFPSLLELKCVYQGTDEATEHVSFIAQKRPWKAQPLGMTHDPSQSFNSFSNNQQMPYPPQSVGILNFLVTQLQLLNPIATVVGSLKDRQSHIQ